MIIEHVLVAVTPGRETEFEAQLPRAYPIIEAAPGCRGAEFRRQVEDPSTYLLLVRWDSVEAHLAFRETELYAAWRELTHPFYDARPQPTHFSEPVEH